MTNKEALTGTLLYPLDVAAIDTAIIDRGLNAGADYTGRTKEYELAQADLFALTATAPKSVSEGGYSISSAEAKELMALANKIYARYGETNPYSSTPTISDKSYKW